MAASRGSAPIWSLKSRVPAPKERSPAEAATLSDATTASGPRLHFHGRRKGRKLRSLQAELVDRLLPRLAIELPETGELDPQRLFGGAANRPGEAPGERLGEIWLEVGFGAGEHLVWQAAHNPSVGLIGCEVFLNGVARCLSQIASQKIDNIRLFPDDARRLMARLPAASLDRFFLLFPDPWPKTRHAERRFINPTNLDLLARLLKPGAELRLASDDPGLIGWMLAQTLAHPDFDWIAAGPGDWRSRPADWPATRYEAKALAEGRPPAYLRFRRKTRPPGQ